MRIPLYLLFAAAVAACSSTDRVTAPVTNLELALSDAIHQGGTPGFYFLPPIVRQPTFSGTFDAGQLTHLKVRVCDLTSGGCPVEFPSTAIKLALADQEYQVNWNTSGLPSGHLYELVVATETHTLGWADVLLTDRSGAVPAPDDVYMTRAGRTIPIKFRIEQLPFVITGIRAIESFLEKCPTNDPAYAQIRQDFEFLADGQPDLSPITCTEPISTLPIDQLTDELIAVQVLRTAYYMSVGTEGKLPWTQKSLYAWMASSVNGIDFRTAATNFFCCEPINGKTYFVALRQDAFNRDFKRTWFGISSSLNVYAHEIRHVAGPGHVSGCPVQPVPVPAVPPACDATYDLTDLGSYGVQYWLESSWATGYLNIGIGCSPFATALAYATWDATSANGYRINFVTNVPPLVTVSPPYGGPCIP